jgi:hypothetical protein
MGDLMDNFSPIFFYRYEDRQYEDGPRISLLTYIFEKETPSGYWIGSNWPFGYYSTLYRRRWISKTSVKKYAYPTKEKALLGYLARKRRQIAILKSQLESAEICFNMAAGELNEKFNNRVYHPLERYQNQAWRV